MHCRKCGELIGMAHNCPVCDTPAGVGSRYCHVCGKKVGILSRKCKHCGALFYHKCEDYLDGHNRFVIALTALLFGELGIHCFIMGERKKGVDRLLWTLLCGIGVIIALIDAIAILTGNYECEPDNSPLSEF